MYVFLCSDDILVLLSFASLAGVCYVFASPCVKQECTAGIAFTAFFLIITLVYLSYERIISHRTQRNCTLKNVV